MELIQISDITKFADSLGRSIRAHYSWSRKLRRAVVVGRAIKSNEIVGITIEIAPGNLNLKKMALAFERGSGLHGKRKRKYKIEGKPWLAFYGTHGYGNAYGAFNPITRKGVGRKTIVITRRVMHPGVRRRGDIQKAIKAMLPKASNDLKLKIRKNLVNGMKIMLKSIGN